MYFLDASKEERSTWSVRWSGRCHWNIFCTQETATRRTKSSSSSLTPQRNFSHRGEYAKVFNLPLAIGLARWSSGKTSSLAMQRSWVQFPPRWFALGKAPSICFMHIGVRLKLTYMLKLTFSNCLSPLSVSLCNSLAPSNSSSVRKIIGVRVWLGLDHHGSKHYAWRQWTVRIPSYRISNLNMAIFFICPFFVFFPILVTTKQ